LCHRKTWCIISRTENSRKRVGSNNPLAYNLTFVLTNISCRHTSCLVLKLLKLHFNRDNVQVYLLLLIANRSIVLSSAKDKSGCTCAEHSAWTRIVKPESSLRLDTRQTRALCTIVGSAKNNPPRLHHVLALASFGPRNLTGTLHEPSPPSLPLSTYARGQPLRGRGSFFSLPRRGGLIKSSPLSFTVSPALLPWSLFYSLLDRETKTERNSASAASRVYRFYRMTKNITNMLHFKFVH